MALTYRPATLQDAELLYRWRLDGEDAEWYEGPPTAEQEHLTWLHLRLDSPAVRIWIVEDEELDGPIPVAVLRLDSNGEVSVEVDPAWRGQGIGTAALKWVCEQANGRVKACVDATNQEARAAFLKAGFRERPDVKFFLWKP